MTTWQKNKKKKTLQYDKIIKWTEQLEEKLTKETDEMKRIWLSSQIRHNKDFINGKTQSESDNICLSGWRLLAEM